MENTIKCNSKRFFRIYGHVFHHSWKFLTILRLLGKTKVNILLYKIFDNIIFEADIVRSGYYSRMSVSGTDLL